MDTLPTLDYRGTTWRVRSARDQVLEDQERLRVQHARHRRQPAEGDPAQVDVSTARRRRSTSNLDSTPSAVSLAMRVYACPERRRRDEARRRPV